MLGLIIYSPLLRETKESAGGRVSLWGETLTNKLRANLVATFGQHADEVWEDSEDFFGVLQPPDDASDRGSVKRRERRENCGVNASIGSFNRGHKISDFGFLVKNDRD